MAALGRRNGHRHYAWTILAITFLALLISAGMRSTPAVLLVPLEHAMGWSRAAISLAIAVQLLTYGLVGPFAAAFIDRFGARATMLGGLVLMILGCALTALASQSWQLILCWGLAMGLGTGAVAMVMAAQVATRWFHTRRGLAMGLLTGSAAGGQMLFLPLLAEIIELLDWRAAIAVACGITFAVIPLVLLLMRDAPADVGARPYGLPAAAPPPPLPPPANPFTVAFEAFGTCVASRDFWLLSGSFLICGASTLGLINTHFIPACLDHGLTEATAASILAAMGVLSLIGTTAAGWMSDRLDSRHLLFWYYALRGVALLFLPYAFDLSFWGLSLFSIFYGLDWIATVPPTIRLTADSFGAQRAGVVYGWILVMHQLGSAALAYGAGLMRTQFGDYLGAFLLAGILCLIAAVLVLGVGRRSRRAPPRPMLATAES